MDNDTIRDIINDIGGDDVSIRTGIGAPSVTLLTVAENRRLCEQNLCGHYGTCWSCPPNLISPEECVSKVSSFSRAAVAMKVYSIDAKDNMATNAAALDMRSICRAIHARLDSMGVRNLVLADGPCSFCGECASLVGKPCRHPEKQIASVSGYGVDMGAYLASIGETFEFMDNMVTMYGIVLFE